MKDANVDSVKVDVVDCNLKVSSVQLDNAEAVAKAKLLLSEIGSAKGSSSRKFVRHGTQGRQGQGQRRDKNGSWVKSVNLVQHSMLKATP
ncbi:hypothetical protein SAY87_023982 [Trapa incisa]|uniref:Uncharacterized protein n=1 Tax=Trapa incisa TaxID=236973 RepID=A0AAN7KZI1_9MYRT|nr:hypothetical protein SAY87_023982 [Trapa incisa]